jgi:hypothetical protein
MEEVRGSASPLKSENPASSLKLAIACVDKFLSALAQEPNLAAISGIFSGPKSRIARIRINSNSNPLKLEINSI